jgi:hypothetical protein
MGFGDNRPSHDRESSGPQARAQQRREVHPPLLYLMAVSLRVFKRQVDLSQFAR